MSKKTKAGDVPRKAAGARRGGLLDEPLEDWVPESCDVCQGQTGYSTNPMLHCVSCDVWVHALCYGAQGAAASGEPFRCTPCSRALAPGSLPCALCMNPDGALKPTTDKRWVHVMCAMLSPDVYFGDPDAVEPVDIRHFNRKRFKLRCRFCKEMRGSCIQCNGPKCAVSYHIRCMVRTPAITRTTLRDHPVVGSSTFKTFCPRHKPDGEAVAGSAALVPTTAEEARPLFNARRDQLILSHDTSRGVRQLSRQHDLLRERLSALMANADIAGADAAVVVASPNGPSPAVAALAAAAAAETISAAPAPVPAAASDAASGAKVAAAPAAAPVAQDAASTGAAATAGHGGGDAAAAATAALGGGGASSGDRQQRQHRQQRLARTCSTTSRDSGRNSPRFGAGRVGVGGGGNGKGPAPRAPRGRPPSTRDTPIASFADWVETDQKSFWKVLAPFFPEELTEERFRRRAVALREVAIPACHPAFRPPQPPKSAVAAARTAAAAAAAATAQSEEDEDENEPSSLAAAEAGSSSGGGGAHIMPGVEDSSETESDEESRTRRKMMEARTTAAAAAAAAAATGTPASSFANGAVGTAGATAAGEALQTPENVPGLKFFGPVAGHTKLSALLQNGDDRVACHFAFRSGGSCGGSSSINTSALQLKNINGVKGSDRRWLVWEPTRGGTAAVASEPFRWEGADNLATGGGKGRAAGSDSGAGRAGQQPPIEVALLGFRVLGGRETPVMTGGLPVPAAAATDTEICLQMRQLQRQLRQEVEHVRTTVETPLPALEREVARAQRERAEWASTEQRFIRSQAWKAVATALEQGLKDQKPDFNRHVEEATNASWLLVVEGRPAPPGDGDGAGNSFMEKEKQEDGVEEDSVCAVCFDGSPTDSNQIVYCDGCNMSAHQHCYGLDEVPEGDFYCERCVFLRMASAEFGASVKKPDAVIRCALCPQLHGGLKRTTDDRFCHLACALWEPGARIVDVTTMGPLDISCVPGPPPPMLSSAETMAAVAAAKQRAADKAALPALSVGRMVPVPEGGDSNSCVFCRHPGGSLVGCAHARGGSADSGGGSCNGDGDGLATATAAANGSCGCGHRFHFLCAWFAGALVSCTVTDPSTLSGEELVPVPGSSDGAMQARGYPSGIKLEAYCPEHTPASAMEGPRGSTSQAALRTTYRLKPENHLQLLRAAARKSLQRSKPKDGARESVGGGVRHENGGRPPARGRSSGAVVASDRERAAPLQRGLEPDDYSGVCCAVCAEPRKSMLELYHTLRKEKEDARSSRSAVAAGKDGASSGDTAAGAADDDASGGGESGATNAAVASSDTPPAATAPSAAADAAFPPAAAPAATDASVLSASDAVGGAAAAADADPDAAEAPVVPLEEGIVQCDQCSVRVHRACYGGTALLYDAASGEGWTCDPCSTGYFTPSCITCPRRGGAFRATDDHIRRWVHAFCADNVPGVVVATKKVLAALKAEAARKGTAAAAARSKAGGGISGDGGGDDAGPAAETAAEVAGNGAAMGEKTDMADAASLPSSFMHQLAPRVVAEATTPAGGDKTNPQNGGAANGRHKAAASSLVAEATPDAMEVERVPPPAAGGIAEGERGVETKDAADAAAGAVAAVSVAAMANLAAAEPAADAGGPAAAAPLVDGTASKASGPADAIEGSPPDEPSPPVARSDGATASERAAPFVMKGSGAAADAVPARGTVVGEGAAEEAAKELPVAAEHPTKAMKAPAGAAAAAAAAAADKVESAAAVGAMLPPANASAAAGGGAEAAGAAANAKAAQKAAKDKAEDHEEEKDVEDDEEEGAKKLANRVALLATIRLVPKALRRQRCDVCGLRIGSCVHCSNVGPGGHPCHKTMHPLCAMLASTDVYSRPLVKASAAAAAGEDAVDEEALLRPRAREFYCKMHRPDGLYRLSTGHWVNMHGLCRMRTDMDRARLLADVSKRRERLKRNLFRASGQQFDECLSQLLQRVPPRREQLREHLEKADPRGTFRAAIEAAAAEAAVDTALVASDAASGDAAAAATAVPAARPAAASATAEATRSPAAADAAAAAAGASTDTAAAEAATEAPRASIDDYPVYSPLEWELPPLPKVPKPVKPKVAKKSKCRAATPPSRRKTAAKGADVAADAAWGGSPAPQQPRKDAQLLMGKRQRRPALRPGEDPKMGICELHGKLRQLCISSVCKHADHGSFAGPALHMQYESPASYDKSRLLRDSVISAFGRRLLRRSSFGYGHGGTAAGVSSSTSGGTNRGGVADWNAAGSAVGAAVTAGKGKGKEAAAGIAARAAGKRGKLLLSTDPEEVAVDRQCFELVEKLLSHMVDIPPKTSPAGWTTLDKSRRKRKLAEVFLEVPTHRENPQYRKLVAHPVDLETIRARVQSRYYQDLSGCLSDVELMLKNADLAGDPQAVRDAKAFRALLPTFQAEVLGTNRRIYYRFVGHRQEGGGEAASGKGQPQPKGTTRSRRAFPGSASPVRSPLISQRDGGGNSSGGASSTAGAAVGDVVAIPGGGGTCDSCGAEAAPVPVAAAQAAKWEADAPGKVSWRCGSCVSANPMRLLGCRVRVLFDVSAQPWYPGVVQAYDAVSGRHRVLYDNNEWEFLDVNDNCVVYENRQKQEKEVLAATTQRRPHKKRQREPDADEVAAAAEAPAAEAAAAGRDFSTGSVRVSSVESEESGAASDKPLAPVDVATQHGPPLLGNSAAEEEDENSLTSSTKAAVGVASPVRREGSSGGGPAVAVAKTVDAGDSSSGGRASDAPLKTAAVASRSAAIAAKSGGPNRLRVGTSGGANSALSKGTSLRVCEGNGDGGGGDGGGSGGSGCGKKHLEVEVAAVGATSTKRKRSAGSADPSKAAPEDEDIPPTAAAREGAGGTSTNASGGRKEAADNAAAPSALGKRKVGISGKGSLGGARGGGRASARLRGAEAAAAAAEEATTAEVEALAGSGKADSAVKCNGADDGASGGASSRGSRAKEGRASSRLRRPAPLADADSAKEAAGAAPSNANDDPKGGAGGFKTASSSKAGSGSASPRPALAPGGRSSPRFVAPTRVPPAGGKEEAPAGSATFAASPKGSGIGNSSTGAAAAAAAASEPTAKKPPAGAGERSADSRSPRRGSSPVLSRGTKRPAGAVVSGGESRANGVQKKEEGGATLPLLPPAKRGRGRPPKNPVAFAAAAAAAAAAAIAAAAAAADAADSGDGSAAAGGGGGSPPKKGNAKGFPAARGGSAQAGRGRSSKRSAAAQEEGEVVAAAAAQAVGLVSKRARTEVSLAGAKSAALGGRKAAVEAPGLEKSPPADENAVGPPGMSPLSTSKLARLSPRRKSLAGRSSARQR